MAKKKKLKARANPIIEIRRNADGVVRKYQDDCAWGGDYIWSEGNWSCDCNRFLFFERAAGEVPQWNDGVCGDGAYSVRVTDVDGNELYADDDWHGGA